MTYFINTDEFVSQFVGMEDNEFYDHVSLNDTKVGFSVKRHYPSDIRYKPAIGQKSNNPDNMAVIWVVYTHPDDTRKEVSSSKVPIRIRIATMSQYLANHFDYNYSDEEGDCPTLDSVEASASTPQPIELEYPGEYFYNHELNNFIDRHGNSLTGMDILNKVFDDHCRTVHLLWGLRLRVKLLTQDKFAGLLGGFVSTIELILKHFFGRTIEDDDALAGLFRPYKPESMKKYDSDSLNVLGYKASKRVVVVFCALVITMSYCRYLSGTSEDYWSTVGDSEFLSLAHGLILIWLLDVVAPWVLFWLMNSIIMLKAAVLSIRPKSL